MTVQSRVQLPDFATLVLPRVRNDFPATRSRQLFSPMPDHPPPPSIESPDVRNESGLALPQLAWTSPMRGRRQAQDGAVRGSSNHSRDDTVPLLDWQARVLSNVIDLVGSELWDIESFTWSGYYQTVVSMIRHARELASLETDEGKNRFLYLCAWPVHHCTDRDQDRFLAAFAVERFRKKHDGIIGDNLPAQQFNRYLGYMKLVEAIELCIANQ